MITNDHIRIGGNSYEKEKTFKCLGSLVTNQNSIQDEKNVDLQQEIHVIIQCKYPFSYFIDFSLRIWKLKFIKQYQISREKFKPESGFET